MEEVKCCYCAVKFGKMRTHQKHYTSMNRPNAVSQWLLRDLCFMLRVEETDRNHVDDENE